MKPSIISVSDRAELTRLVADRYTLHYDMFGSPIVKLLSKQSAAAIHEAEQIVGSIDANPTGILTSFRFLKRASDFDPAGATVLMFNKNGHIRETALNELMELPVTPFYVAAVAWRLNDWVPSVRIAAEACLNRCLPKLSAEAIVGAALFLLPRMSSWSRWGEPPETLLAAFSRSDCTAELAARIRQSADLPASVVRSALRYGIFDAHLTELAGNAKRPEHRAVVLKALLEQQATWVLGYDLQWVDKRYGFKRLVPRIGRRPLAGPTSAEALIRRAATDRSPLVRRVAASGLITHATSVSDLNEMMTLFKSDTSRSVQWCMDYLASKSPEEGITSPTRHPAS